MRTIYVKSVIPYSIIYKILNKQRKQKIIFHIDLQSVCKGFYNKNNIFTEINHYLETGKPSDILIDEYKNYLNNLFVKFKQYKPYFITFYDLGKNKQNTAISAKYKQGRSSLSDIIEKDEELLLYKQIKKRYFEEIKKKFTINGVGKVYYLKDFESDLIPYYVISKNLFESDERHTLNVIISNDKDLLQCCNNNTIMVTNTYKPNDVPRLKIECWDYDNAVTYIYRKFKQGGSITAKHIPLILALAGDKADNIPGIKGIGPVKAISLIDNFDIPFDPLEIKNKIKDMPLIIQENIDLITTNIQLISFEEQLKRTVIED